MKLSVLDLFKIGIGPSSSHTVGPMIAGGRFVGHLLACAGGAPIARIEVALYGSLAWTGKGHATDRAVLLGLSGERPDEITPQRIDEIVARYEGEHALRLADGTCVPFAPPDLEWRRDETLPFHPNGMRFRGYAADGTLLLAETWYSVGGGFVVSEAETQAMPAAATDGPELPYPFTSAAELLALGARHGLAIAELVMANEGAFRPAADTEAKLDAIWAAMDACIARGLVTDGVLPGGLKVKRRAADMYRRLSSAPGEAHLAALDWLNVWALAVNEENAAGGRVVTAPTNGAAGIVPAVLKYCTVFVKNERALVRRFLLTAGAIGMLYKRNASLSAAEMGCQGEVGVACSMAAAGLAAVLGGSNAQIENAAEIGMEHNLGLTCDPIKGLVQIPCIERNTMGAVKAVNAARLAVLHGDGTHQVSLDSVIRTMKQTGLDMQSRYKETSTGGLAVNVPDC
ncbi:MAG: L-serine ammonia-lyase [Gammaproteobacteria bacterium]